MGPYGGALKSRVRAVADRGRANAELARFVAMVLGVRRSGVVLISGQTHRTKRFSIVGIDLKAAVERLNLIDG